MRKIKKGDTVVVIKGKDSGKQGEIVSVNPETKTVIIENINLVKKTVKKTQETEGAIQDIPAPISWSNVMLIDKKTSKRTRVRFEVVKGKKHRVSVKSGETI